MKYCSCQINYKQESENAERLPSEGAKKTTPKIRWRQIQMMTLDELLFDNSGHLQCREDEELGRKC